MESLAVNDWRTRPIPARLRRVKPGGRRCPSCGNLSVIVIDSRPRGNGGEIRRRLGCQTCGLRFTTVESLVTMDYAGMVIDPRAAIHFQQLYASLSSADRRAVTRIMRAFKSVGNDNDDGTADASGADPGTTGRRDA